MAIPRQLPNAITIARIRWRSSSSSCSCSAHLWSGGHRGALDRSDPLHRRDLHGLGRRYLARRYDIVSDFGKLWDPIADKLLTGAGFIGLAVLGELQWWIVVVILIREWGITVHRLMVAKEHVVAAAWMGKIKTAVQGVALSWALLPLYVLIGVEAWVLVTVVLMIVVLILTVASGIDYIVAQVRGARHAR